MHKVRTAILSKEKELRLAIIHEMGKTYAGSFEDIEALTNALEWYPNAMKNFREYCSSKFMHPSCSLS